jgi:hypothetical protein
MYSIYPSSSLSGFLAGFSKPNIGRCVEQKSGKSYFGSAHKTDKVRNCHCTFVLARKGNQCTVARGKISTFCLQYDNDFYKCVAALKAQYSGSKILLFNIIMIN